MTGTELVDIAMVDTPKDVAMVTIEIPADLRGRESLAPSQTLVFLHDLRRRRMGTLLRTTVIVDRPGDLLPLPAEDLHLPEMTLIPTSLSTEADVMIAPHATIDRFEILVLHATIDDVGRVAMIEDTTGIGQIVSETTTTAAAPVEPEVEAGRPCVIEIQTTTADRTALVLVE